ncbi:hypothetical protein K7X08_006969 [Anisodus acutangulus]|uniref:Uncharacterized protein n=1 Tax=Anisodus acutangulus TaxID=402998 RepID=A0A9Q1QZU7_9SOLA|nr:hypothetical protein K7X08_006969 [Anisodus acutangulus]
MSNIGFRYGMETSNKESMRSSRVGSVFATGSPLLTRKSFYQIKTIPSRATSVSIRCEQSNLDVWLGRSAMVGFAVAITIEIATGKGLLELVPNENFPCMSYLMMGCT